MQIILFFFSFPSPLQILFIEFGERLEPIPEMREGARARREASTRSRKKFQLAAVNDVK